jgi:large subunit ribosomal protein L24
MMTRINPKFIHTPKHQKDKMIGATLTDDLRKQLAIRGTRVVKGDSIRVLRGEYKGVEGKVEEVLTESGSIYIEGVKREKIRGGTVKVPIHASNVAITALKLDDNYRSTKLQKSNPPKREVSQE